MTEIRKSKQCLAWQVLVTCREPLGRTIEYWNLKFICNLVLGFCDFRHKTPRQSHISLTRPRGPGFSGLKINTYFLTSILE